MRARLRVAVALALLALQGAVALSPLAESVHTDRPQVHVEQRGATHPFAHNEATCALCAVRSMHAAVQARAFGDAMAPRHEGAIVLVTRDVPSLDDGPTNLSRAPPLAG